VHTSAMAENERLAKLFKLAKLIEAGEAAGKRRKGSADFEPEMSATTAHRRGRPRADTAPQPWAVLLAHHALRFYERLRRKPDMGRHDIELARVLISVCGDLETGIQIIDKWFVSRDPWYERQGFAFAKCLTALTRLVASGEIQPRGTDDLRRAVRQFSKATLDEPIP